MFQTSVEQSAAPAGTAPAAVISLESGEVDQTNIPTQETLEPQPRPIAATETQLKTPAPAGGTFAIAKVPVSPAPVVQPPIVPLPANHALAFLGVKPDIKDMTLDEKFVCLK